MSQQHVLSSEYPFRGKIVSIRVDRIGASDDDAHNVEVVEHRGSYAIVATDAQGRIVLVRQYRHAVARTLWEIPAGTAEAGERALDGARRELAEETGYRAAQWRPLGSLFMTPGFCDEILHFFAAMELTAGEQSLDTDEEIEARLFTLSEAEHMIAAGQIADAKTVLAIAWLQGAGYQLGPQTSDT